MRVITKGRFTNPPAPGSPVWWAGRQGTCAVCGGKMELLPTDLPYQEPGIESDTTIRAAFTCPDPHPDNDNHGAVVLTRYLP